MVGDIPDNYESLELIVKERSDGVRWFDVIFDLIAEDCEGDPEDLDRPCTCGLESLGGSIGTLQQCYDRSESVSHGLKYIDIARAIVFLAEGRLGHNESVVKAIDWARKEVEFEESFSSNINKEG